MGDRANFGFVTRTGDVVYLYGHWAGHGMMDQLARAIKRVQIAGRQNDPSYATRIAISDIVGEDWDNDLGWGITVNSLDDNEHSVPVVNWESGHVILYASDPNARTADMKFVMTLDNFVNKFLRVSV